MLPDRYVPRAAAAVAKNDRKLSIVGRVEEVDEGGQYFTLADGTGRVEVFLGESEIRQRSKVEPGRAVRAFLSHAGERLSLDALQVLGSADLNLIKTVDELYKKAGL